MTRRKLAAGNWKMNGLNADLTELEGLPSVSRAEVLICPPATLIERMARKTSSVSVGGQDCHPARSGAHTGDVSARMLADAGATHVILGHSERRQDHGETDALVRSKIEAAWSADLRAILCIGETEGQYKAGETLEVLRGQLAGSLPDGASPDNLIVAYEPVWAIGTGLVPTMAEIRDVHAFLRAELTARFGADTGDGIRLLYGGSVKPGNAAEIFAVPDVDGALVGGASLKSDDFGEIIKALEAAASA